MSCGKAFVVRCQEWMEMGVKNERLRGKVLLARAHIITSLWKVRTACLKGRLRSGRKVKC